MNHSMLIGSSNCYSRVLTKLKLCLIKERSRLALMALAKNPFLRGIESQTDGDAPTLHADPGPLEALPDDSETHSNAWALPDSSDASIDRGVCKQIHDSMNCIGDKYGGPHNYLREHFDLEPVGEAQMSASISNRDAFAMWLAHEFPEADQCVYHNQTHLPALKSENDMAVQIPLCFNVWKLGYDKACSLKPPPGKKVFLELVERYLMEGFKTANEPLLITQPSEIAHLGLLKDLQADSTSTYEAGVLATHSLGYIKGFARTQSLFAVLHFCWKKDIELKTTHPILWSSILTIYAHHLPQETKVDEAMKNMSISCAGSIRRPPNAISMVAMMWRLIETGSLTDYQVFVRKWNQQSTRTHQIVGSKATCVKLIVESAPRPVLTLLLTHIGKFTYENSAWSDESLSSKKIYPGFAFPAKNKTWAARVRVTEESMMLHVEYVQWQHETQVATWNNHYGRVLKRTKQDQCFIAERAAACYHLGQELRTMVPITEAKLKPDWLT